MGVVLGVVWRHVFVTRGDAVHLLGSILPLVGILLLVPSQLHPFTLSFSACLLNPPSLMLVAVAAPFVSPRSIAFCFALSLTSLSDVRPLPRLPSARSLWVSAFPVPFLALPPPTQPPSPSPLFHPKRIRSCFELLALVQLLLQLVSSSQRCLMRSWQLPTSS